MELLDGIDLQKLVRRDGPLDPRRVIHILRQACHSLEDAHAAGLVHRDLKPANLVLCRYGRDWDMVKVVDFGLAKESVGKPGGAKKLTLMRTVLGTAAYLAPESRTGSVHVDHRADLYGLACIAFWLLSGRLVFDEKSPIRMVNAHVMQEPPHVREFVPEVNEDLDSLIHKCLAKDPADRIQDARAMRTALDAMSRDEYWTDAEAREWWESESESP
jgi:serine/threonine-protein kinase